MGYRRGFKTEANNLASEVRAEMGLRSIDSLDPWRLAELLAIPVERLTAYADSAPNGVDHLTETDPSVFSAVTVFFGHKRLIVHNDSHSLGRQASNVAHELSHGLLLHPPTPALDDSGCRLWDQSVEDEAAWLAGCLLITEDGALFIARNGMSLTDAATKFGVSEKMVEYRLNVTGARLRVARARRFRPRSAPKPGTSP